MKCPLWLRFVGFFAITFGFLTQANAITVVLIGDSTVTDAAGWGKAFANRFGENVKTVNLAVGGRSAKSWFNEGRLPKIGEAMPDFVLIQFGHNGQPGKGPKRETNPDTTYRDYLKIYINEVRKIGATPILVSSVTRRDFGQDGKIRVKFSTAKGAMRPLKNWADATKAVAEEMGVPFIDLYRLSVDYHNKIGPVESISFAPKEDDRTHFNEKGAEAIANLIVTELPSVEKNLAAFLKKDS